MINEHMLTRFIGLALRCYYLPYFKNVPILISLESPRTRLFINVPCAVEKQKKDLIIGLDGFFNRERIQSGSWITNMSPASASIKAGGFFFFQAQAFYLGRAGKKREIFF
jgi:hypothetical protein